jgi:hypothetical protein
MPAQWWQPISDLTALGPVLAIAFAWFARPIAVSAAFLSWMRHAAA